MMIFYQTCIFKFNNLSEITEIKYTSLIKIIIKEENFKWHLEAFASELFILGRNTSINFTLPATVNL